MIAIQEYWVKINLVFSKILITPKGCIEFFFIIYTIFLVLGNENEEKINRLKNMKEVK